MYKVSVIIPVYRVQPFIERCARSLFEQTLDSLEFIFVDDCSPDDSISILLKVADEYPDRKDSVKIVYHSENKGLPLSRQSGISLATGQYIVHCDSDDWLDKDLLEKVYSCAVQDNCDVVMYDCLVVDQGKKTVLHSEKSVEPQDCINKMMHRRIWWSLCNKAFKREVYSRELFYPKDTMGEDMCLTIQLMTQCHIIGYVHGFYNYCVHDNSIMQSVSFDTIFDKYNQLVSNIRLLQSYFSEHNYSISFEKGINYLEYNAKFVLLPIIGTHQGRCLWEKDLKRITRLVLWDRDATIKERFRAFLVLLRLFPTGIKK